MFDDLRNIADNPNDFADEKDADLEPLLEKKSRKSGPGLKFSSNNFLGMNAFQRFVISALLFLLVVMLGTMLLMITSSSLLF
ncbi:MAG TPA: hypothetical protein VGK00_10240 [Anaerolineales bacterium]|jgi:hypothetical protein